MKTYTDRLEQMVQIGQSLASTHDHAKLFQIILVAARELTNCEATSLALYDSESETLQLRSASWKPKDEPIALTLLPNRSLAGLVYRSAEPAALAEPDLKSHLYDDLSMDPGFKIRSVLGVPLMVKHVVIGVIEALNKNGDTRFSPADAEALSLLAEQAAIALENARIFSILQETASRLSALDRTQSDFLAIASHELRTPLQHIVAQATLLRDAAHDELADQVDSLLTYADRLNKIVDDLVNLVNLESGQVPFVLESFALDDLLRQVESECTAAARTKRIKLHMPHLSEPVILQADREKIRLVLAHLLNNAIKFSPPNDDIVVSAESSFEQVRISVSNNGPLIPPEQRELIFDRFYQVEDHLTRQHEGLGLGLPIAKAVVELHDGRIWAESAKGKGTHFTFVLPLKAAVQPGSRAVSSPLPITPVPPDHVLAEPFLKYDAGTADDSSDFDEFEGRIHQLLQDVGRVLPEMLPPLPKHDAEAHLARYAMRHPDDAYLLSDYSLARAGDYYSELSPNASPDRQSQLKETTPSTSPSDAERLPARTAVKPRQERSTATPTAGSPPATGLRFELTSSAAVTPPDDENRDSERRKRAVALIMMLTLALATCFFSLIVITGRTPEALLASLSRATATNSPEPSPSITPSPTVPPPTATPTITATAVEPATTATPLSLASQLADEPITLDIRNLSGGENWTTCMPVNNQLGDRIGQVCLSLAAAYVDSNGQLLAVENMPAIIAVWVRLDSLTGASSELLGISTDPTSDLLPEGRWMLAQIGSQFDLVVGDWTALVTIIEIDTQPFPLSPDSAPFFKAFSIELTFS